MKRMESKYESLTKPPEMFIEHFSQELEAIHAEVFNYGGDCNREILKRNLISGLGPTFVDILEDFDAGSLATEWQPCEIKKLIPIAKEYLNGITSSHSRKRSREEMS